MGRYNNQIAHFSKLNLKESELGGRFLYYGELNIAKHRQTYTFFFHIVAVWSYLFENDADFRFSK